MSDRPVSSTMSAARGTTALLDAVDLYRFYHAGEDETLALRGVSLRLYPNEVVAVTGPSGSGKSTLLACLAGLDEPDGGSVRVGGEMMSRRSEAERAALRASSVGMLFQTGNLLDHLTVEQNVVFAQRLAGRVDRARVMELLTDVGLANRASAAPSTLSGGEAARAGLAVALANNPSVILADEPTGELDEVTSHRIMQLLRQRAQAGAAVLIVTHNELVAAEADREISLRDGQVVR
ncbi:MAG: putative transport system ATP-binding protein [Ilumatobacteraceae bacterium]|nr:putative transport system ATP-binding protein [Ilumatobacteraceae bacterium]